MLICDFVIICKDGCIPTHKFVVYGLSEMVKCLIRDMPNSNYIEVAFDKFTVIRALNILYSTLLGTSVYSDEFDKLNASQFMEIYKFHRFMIIDGWVELCKKYLSSIDRDDKRHAFITGLITYIARDDSCEAVLSYLPKLDDRMLRRITKFTTPIIQRLRFKPTFENYYYIIQHSSSVPDILVNNLAKNFKFMDLQSAEAIKLLTMVQKLDKMEYFLKIVNAC